LLKIDFRVFNDGPNDEWQVLKAVSEGIGVRSTMNQQDLAATWEVSAVKVISLCQFLRAYPKTDLSVNCGFNET
jgi:hypothetical protein